MSCFFVNGKGLRKYCLENNIVYSRVYYWLDKKGLSIEESLKRAVGKREFPQTKFRFGNETVWTYCLRNKLTYNSVIRDVKKKGMDIEEAIRKCQALKGKRGCPRKDFRW